MGFGLEFRHARDFIEHLLIDIAHRGDFILESLEFACTGLVADEQQVREMILQLKRGHLEPDYFAAKFGIAILERFGAAFGELARRGLARLAPERIELTREGLLRADQLLPLFYAPEYQNARYT